MSVVAYDTKAIDDFALARSFENTTEIKCSPIMDSENAPRVTLYDVKDEDQTSKIDDVNCILPYYLITGYNLCTEYVTLQR